MAKLLNEDGTVLDVEPVNGTDFNLAEAQALVGGYVELLDIGWLVKTGQHGCDAVVSLERVATDDAGGIPPRVVKVATDDTFIVNEEGLLMGLPNNPIASALAGRALVGPVLLCKHKEFL